MRRNNYGPTIQKKVSIDGEDYAINDLNIDAIFEQFDKQSKGEPGSASYIKRSDQNSKRIATHESE